MPNTVASHNSESVKCSLCSKFCSIDFLAVA